MTSPYHISFLLGRLFSWTLTYCAFGMAIETYGLAIDLPMCQTLQDKRFPTDQRPEATQSRSSRGLPITLHWNDGMEFEYIDSVLEIAEQSYRYFFEQLKFRKPLPDHGLGGDDHLDIYITSTLDPKYGGYAGFSDYEETTPEIDAYGYLVLSHQIPRRLMRSVIAHEMFHLSQMAYDFFESPSFQEATAVWASYVAFPEEGMVWRYFTFFNDQPHKSLAYIPHIGGPFHYGAALFYVFLSEIWPSPALHPIARLWEATKQTAFENEPDSFDGLQNLLVEYDMDLNQLWRQFGAYRVFVEDRDDGKHFRDSQLWTGWSRKLSPPFLVEMTAAVNSTSGSSIHSQEPLSHGFLSISHHSRETRKTRVQLKVSNLASFAVDAYVKSEADPEWKWVDSRHQMDSTTEIELTLLAVPQAEHVIIISALAGDAFDPETPTLSHARVDFRLQRLE